VQHIFSIESVGADKGALLQERVAGACCGSKLPCPFRRGVSVVNSFMFLGQIVTACISSSFTVPNRPARFRTNSDFVILVFPRPRLPLILRQGEESYLFYTQEKENAYPKSTDTTKRSFRLERTVHPHTTRTSKNNYN